MTTIPGGRAHFLVGFPVSGLRVTGFKGIEEVSGLWRFELNLVADNPDVDFTQIVDQPAYLKILCHDGSEDADNRFFYGIVSHFSLTRSEKSQFEYLAILVPRVYRLTLNSNRRIFQEMTVDAIIEQVLTDAEFERDDFRFELHGTSYPERTFTIQYDESDFAFISRLLESEGISYYFEHDHENEKEILVMDNDSTAFPECAPDSQVRYQPAAGSVGSQEEYIDDCQYREEVAPGVITLGDYDYENPSRPLAHMSFAEKFMNYEVLEFPGGYTEIDRGENIGTVRIQESQATCAVLSGRSNFRSFAAGRRVQISGHFRSNLDGEYTVLKIIHEGQQGSAAGHSAEGVTDYRNEFFCIPSSVPYRPPRKTPAPQIHGLQPAMVTGPSGEEIYIDDLGRVKVQFLWDREGQRNENSSCWIRVGQDYAGQDCGIQFVPRIGWEVLVGFMEGSPDDPVIVSTLYNGETTPVVKSANKTQNVIKTPRDNKILIEDKEGEENFTIRAQKDHTVDVQSCSSESVGADKSVSVGGDSSETVKQKKTVSVSGDSEETVSQNKKVTVSADMEMTISGTYTLNVDTLKDEWNQEKNLNVLGDSGETVNGAKDVTITGNLVESVGGNYTNTTTGNISITGATISLIGQSGIKMVCGGGSIAIDSSGNINIAGRAVTVNGLSIESAADTTHKVSGSMMTVEGSAVTEIKGPIVKQN